MPGGCAMATHEELDRVPADMRPRYILFRRKFYWDLVAYHTLKGSDIGFVNEITVSLTLWEKWAA